MASDKNQSLLSLVYVVNVCFTFAFLRKLHLLIIYISCSHTNCAFLSSPPSVTQARIFIKSIDTLPMLSTKNRSYLILHYKFAVPWITVIDIWNKRETFELLFVAVLIYIAIFN